MDLRLGIVLYIRNKLIDEPSDTEPSSVSENMTNLYESHRTSFILIAFFSVLPNKRTSSLNQVSTLLFLEPSTEYLFMSTQPWSYLEGRRATGAVFPAG